MGPHLSNLSADDCVPCFVKKLAGEVGGAHPPLTPRQRIMQDDGNKVRDESVSSRYVGLTSDNGVLLSSCSLETGPAAGSTTISIMAWSAPSSQVYTPASLRSLSCTLVWLLEACLLALSSHQNLQKGPYNAECSVVGCLLGTPRLGDSAAGIPSLKQDLMLEFTHRRRSQAV